MGSGSSFNNVSQYHKGQGGEVAADGDLRQMVNVGAVSSGLSFEVNPNITVTSATTKHTNSSGASATLTIVAKQATTSLQVRGFSFFNATTGSQREVQLRFGSTAFYYGGLVAEGNFNWNKIAGFPQSADNKSIIVWMDNDGTVIWTVDYKEV